MDRAHRIGQRRVVNVYRLITRHTLEEKIMSLQRFKIHTARTVISADNASLQTMATDQVGSSAVAVLDPVPDPTANWVFLVVSSA
jgi:SNF2 family DNA or RNA helicase